nr:methyltransferase domain-containing protein [Acidimicrobiia bacterium]
ALDATGPTGSVLALDLAPPMVDALADDLAAAGLTSPRAEARLGDLEALDVPDASIDVVVCGFGIFLAPRISVALAEVRRVLRPGGRFAASTFIGGLGGFAWFGEIVGAVAPDAPAPSGTNLITANGLQRPLAVAGFAPPRVEAVTGRFAFPDVDALVAWYRSHGGRATMEALDDTQLVAFRALAAKRLAADDHVLAQHAELTVATAARVPA